MSKRYRTIVADPPWDYSGWGTGRSFGDDHAGGGRTGPRRITRPAYAHLSVIEIEQLPIATLAAQDAHLYLWTTQRYLTDAYRIAETWGFAVSKALVWCKPPTGFALGGTFGSACEFALFCRRGSLKALRSVPRDWFEWPRSGGHSAKPNAFLDLVEQVSPGPYVELFARRARFGWDYWGDESLGTVDLRKVGERATTPVQHRWVDQSGGEDGR